MTQEEMRQQVEWNSGDRVKYYGFRRYMTHINGCKGGGDQACACGMASVGFNLDQLLDEFEAETEVKP